MSFKITCSLQNPLTEELPQGTNPHAGVTCLLTGASFPGNSPGTSKLNRGLNLVSVYLTLGTQLMALSDSDLWVHGQEIQPGVRVLSGQFHLSAANDQLLPARSFYPSVCNLTSTSLETISEQLVPDFQSLFTTTLTVECKPDSWMCWANGQAALSPTNVQPPTRTPISSSQTYKISEQQKELAAAGLDSSILSPFTENLAEFNEHDSEFVPSTTTPLDPKSEEYHQALVKALAPQQAKLAR
ncbi:hypothetical protein ACROYT_G008175 [Oculina patagonica]